VPWVSHGWLLPHHIIWFHSLNSGVSVILIGIWSYNIQKVVPEVPFPSCFALYSIFIYSPWLCLIGSWPFQVHREELWTTRHRSFAGKESEKVNLPGRALKWVAWSWCNPFTGPPSCDWPSIIRSQHRSNLQKMVGRKQVALPWDKLQPGHTHYPLCPAPRGWLWSPWTCLGEITCILLPALTSVELQFSKSPRYHEEKRMEFKTWRSTWHLIHRAFPHHSS
jgi:hypothetical protein